MFAADFQFEFQKLQKKKVVGVSILNLIQKFSIDDMKTKENV